MDFNEDNTEGAVQLVAYDQEKNTWNRNLQFTKGFDDHNGNTVATLTIPFGQSNFRSNGRYFVRVTSANAQGVKSSALASIHVQNHDTPTLKIKENPESGKNLHFCCQQSGLRHHRPDRKGHADRPDRQDHRA